MIHLFNEVLEAWKQIWIADKKYLYDWLHIDVIMVDGYGMVKSHEQNC